MEKQFREYLIASFFAIIAIARNEMAQAEVTIARNSVQFRATEFRLETLLPSRQGFKSFV